MAGNDTIEFRHTENNRIVMGLMLGFTCVNDVTARDFQRADKVFGRAKGFDTFCPLGPWLETDLDPFDLGLECSVHGPDGRVERRQSGRTSSMVFDVPTLVAAVSRVMTLEPGDVIASGTPEGVGPLLDGDVLVSSIEGIGTLRSPVRSDEGVPLRPPPISQRR